MTPIDAVKTTSDLAQILDTYGPWALAAVFLVALCILAHQYRAARDRCEDAIAKIHEAHRAALERVNTQHHEAATAAIRELTDMVKEQTIAMTESGNASNRVAEAIRALERRVEGLENR